jgi:hypothetical protein
MAMTAKDIELLVASKGAAKLPVILKGNYSPQDH